MASLEYRPLWYIEVAFVVCGLSGIPKWPSWCVAYQVYRGARLCDEKAGLFNSEERIEPGTSGLRGINLPLDQTFFLETNGSAVLYNTAMRGFAIKKQVVHC